MHAGGSAQCLQVDAELALGAEEWQSSTSVDVLFSVIILDTRLRSFPSPGSAAVHAGLLGPTGRFFAARPAAWVLTRPPAPSQRPSSIGLCCLKRFGAARVLAGLQVVAVSERPRPVGPAIGTFGAFAMRPAMP
jgi:hypothetical protein